jgi:hypothetical protein
MLAVARELGGIRRYSGGEETGQKGTRRKLPTR